MKVDFAREIALKSLYKIENEKAYSNIVLDENLNKNRNKLTSQDIGLISEIVYGVVTWKLTLDYIIQKYSKVKVKKISKWVINILRQGAYQIIFLDKIPKSAAVNESVNLCKKYGVKSANFVNAILRKINKEDLEELKNIENTTKRISLNYSMPEWIVDLLLKEHSEKVAEEICSNCNIKPKTTIRINLLKNTKEGIEKLLEERNITFKEGNLKDFLYLENVKDITGLDLYKKGLFTMQDEAAGLTAIVLSPKEGEKILDCCSAPGGKTTHIAEIMNNKGKILAWDLYKNRLNLVKENAERLGIDIIKTEENDSSILKDEYIQSFDKVLLDVPCLGLGVMRRKPDIKWQRKKEDIEEINKIQYKILSNCSKYVKKGGIIVYSTCSIISQENENIVNKFVKENDFEIMNPNSEEIGKYSMNIKNNMITLYPDQNNDGFFICKLRKK